MYKYLPLIFAILLTGCLNSSKEKARFTNAQIKSLHIDSAKVLTVNQDSAEKLVLDPFLGKKPYDLGSKINSFDVVPLETTDDGLLDVIYKVLTTKTHIYIHDRLKGGGLVVFTKEGKFVKRMPYGQGPGEINRLYDICYDAENDRLIAYQHSFLTYYTSSGEFIEQKRLPFGFYNFKTVKNGFVFKMLDDQGNDHLGNLKKSTLMATDTLFKIKSAGLPLNDKLVSYGGYSYLYSHGETLSVTSRFVDTVYRFEPDNNKLAAQFILSYDDKKLPKEYLTESLAAFDKATSQNDYYYFLGEYLENDRNNVFFLKNDFTGRKTLIFRDKKTKHLIGGNDPVFDNGKNISTLSLPIAIEGDKFISIHYQNSKDQSLIKSALLSASARAKLTKVTEDDNPVLVFYNLKEF